MKTAVLVVAACTMLLPGTVSARQAAPRHPRCRFRPSRASWSIAPRGEVHEGQRRARDVRRCLRRMADGSRRCSSALARTGSRVARATSRCSNAGGLARWTLVGYRLIGASDLLEDQLRGASGNLALQFGGR